jgi:hypothetical protein
MVQTYLTNYPTDPVNAANYAFTNGAGTVCPAVAGTNQYEIDDTGGHDPTVHIANGTAGNTSVVYCSGSGITGH